MLKGDSDFKGKEKGNTPITRRADGVTTAANVRQQGHGLRTASDRAKAKEP